MAELYTSRLSHAYGEGVYGEAARPAFERQLARIDGASFARSGVVNGMLDNPMPAGFLGGLNLAAKAVTGRDIDLYIDNLRDERNPTLETASAEIQRELRTRYFNKSWVAEMQTHGYEGARTFMYLTDHLDLWDTTATRTVGSDDWREIKRVYVDDSLDVGMDGFFDRYNPHAQQVLLGNLLGAASRGQWEASTADKAQVASRLARSVAAHGIACEANMCRNPALTRLIAERARRDGRRRRAPRRVHARVARGDDDARLRLQGRDDEHTSSRSRNRRHGHGAGADAGGRDAKSGRQHRAGAGPRVSEPVPRIGSTIERGAATERDTAVEREASDRKCDRNCRPASAVVPFAHRQRRVERVAPARRTLGDFRDLRLAASGPSRALTGGPPSPPSSIWTCSASQVMRARCLRSTGGSGKR